MEGVEEEALALQIPKQVENACLGRRRNFILSEIHLKSELPLVFDTRRQSLC